MVPILVLIAGSLSVLAGLQPRFRFVGLVGVVAAGFTLLSLLLMGLQPLPITNILSAWAPASLFPQPLTLRIDAPAWMMGLAVVISSLSVFLTGLARPGGRRLAPRGTSLLITAAALAAVFSADLVTLAVAWGALDLIYFLVLIALAEGDERQAVLSLAFNSAATLLVLAAAVRLTSIGESLQFGEALFRTRAMLLLALAGIFRLGLFPVHLGLPVEVNTRQGLSTVLRLAPAAVALMLLARIITGEGALPLRPWLTVAGVAALWVGAAQWWVASEPRRGLPYLVVSQSGVALLTGLWGGPAAQTGLIAQALALVLGGTVLFLYRGHEQRTAWQAAFPLVAVAALAGVPFLTGFTGNWALYTGLLEQGNFVVLLLTMAGQAVLTAGLLRLCFWPTDPAEEPAPEVVVVKIAYVGGLGLPLFFLLLAGLSPSGLANFLGTGGVPGWLGLLDLSGLVAVGIILLAAIAGVMLWRNESELRVQTDSLWNTLASVTRLDWLYEGLGQAYRAISGVLGLAAEILDGGGAVLWAVVIALVLWLSFSGGVR